jgi:hypothetical protein
MHICNSEEKLKRKPQKNKHTCHMSHTMLSTYYNEVNLHKTYESNRYESEIYYNVVNI